MQADLPERSLKRRKASSPPPAAPGNKYQRINVYPHAKAQLGNTYHFVQESPLSRLPCAANAPFNSYGKQHEPDCLRDTRVDLLQEIYNWADGEDKRCMFWLNGLAGTGKSTIARTVARKYHEQGRLGASFFFSTGGGDVSRVDKFVTSIAVQLAHSVPSLRQHICAAITERGDIANQSLRDQWHQLVIRPLSKLAGNGHQSSYLLVIDALDECDDDDDIQLIVQLLAQVRSLKMVRLRVFLTSRPENPIRHGVCQIPDAQRQGYVLHSISPPIVDHDISIFLEYNLRLIGQEYLLVEGWPSEDVIARLVRAASGLFVWAATACRFIRGGKKYADKRLETIIRGSSNIVAGPENHLNEIYTTVLEKSMYPEYTDEERKEQYGALRHTLGSLVVLFSPVSARSLANLLHVPTLDVVQSLNDLRAILDIPEDQTRPLGLHHPSLRDFLLSKARCKDLDFCVDEKQAHRTLAENCIQLMSTSLAQDICGVEAPGTWVADVEDARIERSLPPELQYACLYWIVHLQKSGVSLCDDNQVHQFLRKHFLPWLEALGRMRKVSEGIHMIESLESLALTHDCTKLYSLIRHIKRFALYGQPAFEQ